MATWTFDDATVLFDEPDTDILFDSGELEEAEELIFQGEVTALRIRSTTAVRRRSVDAVIY